MRLILLLACLAIGGIIVEGKSSRLKRSNGGEPIIIQRASFFVSIRRFYGTYEQRWYHVCGGAFISTRHVLTVAHCFSGEDDHKTFDTIVVSGTHEDRDEGTWHHIRKVILPHEFTIGNFSHNIAVIELVEEVEWNEKRSRILLPTAEPLYYHSASFISFQTMFHRDEVASLSRLQLALFTVEECFDNYLPSDSTLTFCGVAREHQSMSSTDSGAPLIYNGKIIGIGSWMAPITDRARVFTNVYEYLPFINDAMSM